MTLDQAIKYEEDTIRVNTAIINNAKNIDISDMELSRCRRIMEESKQIAEWLTDYKRLLKSTNWIPVSKRTPELLENIYGCLVTVEDNNYKGSEKSQNLFTYSEVVFCDDGIWKNAFETPIPFDVVAWMPLPPNYQGE